MAVRDYDVVVIGSGFGGSVAALRAAEKGYRVGVLEAGRRFTNDTLPETSWDLKSFLWAPALGWMGIQRITPLTDVVALSGAGVGGGSLIYANTLYTPLDDFFADPQWSAITDWKVELSPYYDQASRMLGRRREPHGDARGRRDACGRRGARGRPHLPPHAGRGVLRRARYDGGRPVLRRCGSPSYRVHPVRQLHDRVPVQRQEPTGPQLPPPRRGSRHGDPPGDDGNCDPAARRGWVRRRDPSLDPSQAAPHLHRRPGRAGGRNSGNPEAAAPDA